MNLNIVNEIASAITNIDVNKFINEIAERLEKMEQELTIDRFEGNIAVCEDRNTGKIVEINIGVLPANCAEGTVLKYQNGRYEIDSKEQEKIEKRIQNKMDNLWK